MRGHAGVMGCRARGLARRAVVGMCVALVAGMAAAASAMAATNVWTTTGLLDNGRIAPMMVVLKSGKVLVAGGQDATGSALATTEIYDPSTGQWTDGPIMNRPRNGAAALLLKNGQVLVVGGVGAADSPDTAELYVPNTSTGNFKLLPDLNVARTGASLAPLPDGDVLVMGGTDSGGNDLSSTEIYSFPLSKFTVGPDMTMPRNHPMTTALPNGDVLAAGSDDGPEPEQVSAEVYDPTADTWTPTANAMSAERELGGIAPLPGGRFLLAGGFDTTNRSTDTTDIYDPVTGSFAAGPPMPRRDGAFGIASLANGDVLITGGLDNEPNPTEAIQGVTSSALFDPVAGTWTAVGPLRTGVLKLAMVPLPDGQVLEAGGSPDRFFASPQASLFDPAFVPAAPTGVTATAGDGRVTVSWTAASGNGSPVTQYTVTASTGQVANVTGTDTSATLTDLINGTSVTFTVTATNAVGTSPASAPSSAVTPTAAPAPPATPVTTPPRSTPTSPVTTPPVGARPSPDSAATLHLSKLAARMTLRQFLKGLRFTVTPSKAVALQVTLSGTVNRAVISRFNLPLASQSLRLATGARSVKLVPSRKLVGHPKKARVQLTVVAVDAAGTRSTLTRTVTI